MRSTGWAVMICIVLAQGTQVAVGQWVKSGTPVMSGDHWFFAGTPQRLYAASVAGVMVSTDHGVHWTEADSGIGHATYIRALAVMGDTVFAGTNGEGVYRSIDHGASWVAASSGLISPVIHLLAASHASLVAFTDSGIAVSGNQGGSWTTVYAGTGYGLVNDIIVQGSTVLLGTEKGVFLSTDQGASWTDASTGLENKDVRAFARKGDTLFVGTYGGGVSRTVGFGGTWAAMNDGMSPLNVHSLLSDGVHLWVGTCFGGVFVYDAGEARWKTCSAGLTGSGLDVHALTTTSDNIILGTMGEIWLRPLKEVYTSVVESEPDAPVGFSLPQNYPNPFNPSTEITFSVAKSGAASLRVYDALGREVATLFDGVAESGKTYRLGYDGKGMASGVYMYRLVSGERSEVKRMALVR